MGNKVFVVDVTKCTGCFNCFIACKDEFTDHPWPPYSGPQPETGHYWIKVDEVERGQFPRVKLSFIAQPCQHCSDPRCIKAARNPVSLWLRQIARALASSLRRNQMNTDDFEKGIQRQEWRQAPAEWRQQILGAAREAAIPQPVARLPRRSLLSALNHRLASIFWPSPKAWGALAAAWLVIIAIDFSVRDQPGSVAQDEVRPSPEVRVALEQQKRWLAELIGWPASPDAESPKPGLLRPRSDRRDEELMA